MTGFVIRPPRPPVLTRLYGRNPLLRPIDRVEATIMTLTVVLSVIGLPFALAVTSEQVRADTAPAAAAVAAAVMAGVAVTAAAMCGVTRVVCDRIRTARWEHGLDSLEDAVWP
ncbi:hypothetical protein [Mycolicibacterium thermoresistibile]|uniref:Transmembrane protein n=2 Tax=Mycolicibacterium thermoresistibile TaxID=1797 RepID=G7CCX3_MYCT3|nr:hypothetical protein [Mycolicibacterium thermoresistibile]EHI14133.1 hypothetical protein KEK_04107 [Mycolicibacterium thermoresistibile ATCC 19527]MCV7189799.1 hypothetical protein [Mycolicibacterium thermoresistibile]GAT17580.1 putative uncharacterized protein [Mycolicibacterium thermoresistibile]SNW20737.1 Uncharacterised protein [Mycolicibacterium thermoresistibile]